MPPVRQDKDWQVALGLLVERLHWERGDLEQVCPLAEADDQAEGAAMSEGWATLCFAVKLSEEKELPDYDDLIEQEGGA